MCVLTLFSLPLLLTQPVVVLSVVIMSGSLHTDRMGPQNGAITAGEA